MIAVFFFGKHISLEPFLGQLGRPGNCFFAFSDKGWIVFRDDWLPNWDGSWVLDDFAICPLKFLDDTMCRYVAKLRIDWAQR
ncbi:hypothetical protein Y024_5789 [Burkholderia pseudomallei TSV44]|nr:hypothetical protein Y024_5789 [Burkholderia pseudomallei TSV44]